MSQVRYLISGASGWLGQEFIFFLLRNNKISSLEELSLFSSRERTFAIGDYGVIKTQSFLECDISSIPEAEMFVHLAFLTRDKVGDYGFNAFVQKNELLTSRAVEIIRAVKPSYVINVSSGAVFSRRTSELEKDIDENPYGVCKLNEEEELKKACQKLSINLAIGRLWGATGERMPINRAYAISDLIVMALSEEDLRIKAKNLVLRRYCDAGEFMYLLSRVVRSANFELFDSGGPKVEIGQLADLIASHFENRTVNRSIDSTVMSDDYYPRSFRFEDFAAREGLKLSDINTQVERTLNGHISQWAAIA